MKNIKKVVYILLILSLCAVTLYANERQYYQIFPTALAFNLADDNRGPHSAGWARGSRIGRPSGGNYYDDDMLGCVGVSNVNLGSYKYSYGYIMHVTIENNAQLKTPKDFSAYRNFGIELVPRYQKGNNMNQHYDFNGQMYADRNLTIPIAKTTRYLVADARNPEIWFKFPMNCDANASALWCDLNIILDPNFEPDSLFPDDNYKGTVIVEMFPLMDDYETIDTSQEPYFFVLNCSGYYNVPEPDKFQKYNFFVTPEPITEYLSLTESDYWNDYVRIANVHFSTSTIIQNTRWNANKDFRIILSSTPDYTATDTLFQFNRNGGIKDTIRNTVEYSVAMVPNPVGRAEEYGLDSVENGKYMQIADSNSITAYKPHYATFNTPAIIGTEPIAKRQVQVPLYWTNVIPSSNRNEYIFNYEADLYIKLLGFEGQNNREVLVNGLYSTVVYVTVISEL